MDGTIAAGLQAIAFALKELEVGFKFSELIVQFGDRLA
jgi:hypothetical protein